MATNSCSPIDYFLFILDKELFNHETGSGITLFCSIYFSLDPKY